jgi:hypothetical protein
MRFDWESYFTLWVVVIAGSGFVWPLFQKTIFIMLDTENKMHPEDRVTWIKIGVVYLVMLIFIGYIINGFQP